MKCEIGLLRAYLDDALANKETPSLEAHIAQCANCQRELAAMRSRRELLVERLASLDPSMDELSDGAQALHRLRVTVRESRPSLAGVTRRRYEDMKSILWNKRWRPAAIGIACLLLLVALFSLGPVREAAAEFLGIFRVRKFAAIPVDPAAMDRIEGLTDLLDAGFLGEPTILRQLSPAQEVTDVQEASRLAGFQVREPKYMPDGMSLQRWSVEFGPAMRLDVESSMIAAVLSAAGIEGVELPQGQMSFEADFGPLVTQEYRGPQGEVIIVQMPSPAVEYPTDLNPTLMGEALLRVLGMPEADARRLATTIDWTSTLVIPLPTDIAEYSEVEVGRAQALLVQARPVDKRYPPAGMLLWQYDGIVYVVQGNNVVMSTLLRVADSLS